MVTTAGTVRAGCKEDVAQLDPQIQEKAGIIDRNVVGRPGHCRSPGSSASWPGHW